MNSQFNFLGYTATLEDVLAKEGLGTCSMSVTSARENIGSVINQVKYTKERQLITKHNALVAGIVSSEDLLKLHIFDQLLNESLLAESRLSKDEALGGISLQDLMQESIDGPEKRKA